MTALALEIFDAVTERFDLSKRDRALLEAAARLHDVGYGFSPRAHVRAGASLVMRARLPGFSRLEHAVIAGVILLHAKAYQKNLDHAVFGGPLRGGTQRDRALRLGAFLRIADGLDHGHVQDARIRSISIERNSVRLVVASPAWPGNIAWASEKADLWRKVLPLPIVIRLNPVRQKRLFGAVFDANEPPLESCRRLLFVLFREIGEEWDAALREDDPRHCHDLRVAVRRFRTVLRLYKDALRKTPAAKLREQLGELADLMGPPRDADVWLRTLSAIVPSAAAAAVLDRTAKPSQGTRSHKGRSGIFAAAHESRAAGLATMRAALRAADEDGLRRRITTFLRVTMHEVAVSGAQRGTEAVVSQWTARSLARAVDRAARRGVWKEEPSAERLHDYRRIVRRGRYTAEFFAPVLGPAADDLACRFKAMADALGDHHDASVGLERLASLRETAARKAGDRGLERGLEKMIARSWRAFRRERRKFDRLVQDESRWNKKKLRRK